jgi:hypothetical protein
MGLCNRCENEGTGFCHYCQFNLARLKYLAPENRHTLLNFFVPKVNEE